MGRPLPALLLLEISGLGPAIVFTVEGTVHNPFPPSAGRGVGNRALDGIDCAGAGDRENTSMIAGVDSEKHGIAAVSRALWI